MSDPQETIGFVGLGRMGVPMVANLIRAGFAVRAFDVSPQARDAAVAASAQAAAEIAELAGCSMIVLMLPDSDDVEAVVGDLTAAGLLAEGVLVADMSSSQAVRTRKLSARIASTGARMIDAPVSGGVGGAVRGALTIMVGGDPADVDRARGALAAMGNVVPVGEIGAGHAMKALNNLLSATHLWITGEVMAAGARFGLDPEVMLEIFNRSSGRSGSTERKWPDFVVPATYASGFGLRLMLKDVRMARDLCAHTGSFGGLTAEAERLWAAAADDLEPTADHTEIAKWIVAKEGGSSDIL